MPTLELLRPAKHQENLMLHGKAAAALIQVAGISVEDENVYDVATAHVVTRGTINPDRPETAMSFHVWTDPSPDDATIRAYLLGVYDIDQIGSGHTAKQIKEDGGVDISDTFTRLTNTGRNYISKVRQSRRLGESLRGAEGRRRAMDIDWRTIAIGSVLNLCDPFDDIPGFIQAARIYEESAGSDPNPTVRSLKQKFVDKTAELRRTYPLPQTFDTYVG